MSLATGLWVYLSTEPLLWLALPLGAYAVADGIARAFKRHPLANPVLHQEVHFNPTACTYYYGFSVSQPPFNNALVRKAFIAATRRLVLSEERYGDNAS